MSISTVPAKTGYTAIHCNILRETEKAVLIAVAHSATEIWLPLSQCSYVHKQKQFLDTVDFTDTVHVKDWLVDKNNLEE